MIKEMNREIFLQSFNKAIEEMKQKASITDVQESFIINPIYEEGKKLSGKDQVMRLNILNTTRVNGQIYTKEEVISMLTLFSPLVPLWIDLKYIPDYKGKTSVFCLNCSLRLTKPSLLRNQESGHPPFKVIVEEHL